MIKIKSDAYLTKIIQDTGLPRSEIQKLVEKKKGEFEGLISDEGALFLVAQTFGVDVRSENTDILKEIDINISDIKSNMKNITLVGRIKEIYKIYEFDKDNNEKGYVGSFLLHDPTGEIRVTLWNEHVNLFSDESFKKNELIKILNSYAKEGRFGTEIHVGRLGKVVVSPDDVDYKKYPKIKEEFIEIEKINNILKSVSIEGKIIKKFPIKTFTKSSGETGSLESIILMDNTGTIRVNFWDENIEKIDDFKQDDYLSITNLRPRESNLQPNLINLHATRTTNISKKESNLKLDIELSNNLKELQNKNNLVSFKGMITSLDELKMVTLKSGNEIDLLSFIVSDETDFIRVAVWGKKAKNLSKELSNEMGITIKNALIRTNSYSGRKEVTLIEDSIIEKIDANIKNPVRFDTSLLNINRKFSSNNITKIKDIKSPGIYEIKGLISKELRRINLYNACSICFKKIENCSCEEKGEITPRMIINLLIDDETGVIRASFIGDTAEKLIGKETELIMKVMDTPDFDRVLDKISTLLVGRDIYLKGKVKFNDYSNAYELNVFDFQDIDIDSDLKQIITEI